MCKAKIGLKNYLPDEVNRLIKELGEPSFRADQILDWIYKKKVSNWEDMTNLPIKLREKFKSELQVDLLTIEDKSISGKDGTEKYLFKTMDDKLLECSVMKQSYGNTVCVSSQIGCGLSCKFCASSRGGLIRNLTTGEMLDQVIMAERNLETDARINNIVVMGMGEPLYNLNNLVKFLKLANDPKGLLISMRNITVSTAGIAPKIEDFSREKLPVTLAVSLHAPDNETRSKLMPINDKYSIEDILDSCKIYIDKVGRRITFEYVLIQGINDSQEKASQLATLLKGLLCHVNLIPANPIGNEDIKRPDKKSIQDFYRVLEDRKISVSIRKERGSDIEGACGQLKSRYLTIIDE